MRGSANLKIRPILLAVAGLLVAGALGAASSQLTSQQVGLAGQPNSGSAELVAGGGSDAGGRNADRSRNARKRRGGRRGAGNAGSSTPPPRPPATPPPVATAPPPAATSTPKGDEEPNTPSPSEPESQDPGGDGDD